MWHIRYFTIMYKYIRCGSISLLTVVMFQNSLLPKLLVCFMLTADADVLCVSVCFVCASVGCVGVCVYVCSGWVFACEWWKRMACHYHTIGTNNSWEYVPLKLWIFRETIICIPDEQTLFLHKNTRYLANPKTSS